MNRKQSAAPLGALFLSYCAVMLLLLFARVSSVTGMTYWEQVRSNLSLEPLHTIRLFLRVLLNENTAYHNRLAVINLAGNILMFVPLGYFLPRLWKILGRWYRTWLAAAGIITAVEIAQLFTLRGVCDIDDLILNLLGVALGYGVYFCFCKKCVPN